VSNFYYFILIIIFSGYIFLILHHGSWTQEAFEAPCGTQKLDA
jgi:hypothetical protein